MIKKSLFRLSLYIFPLLISSYLFASDTIYYELWDISALDTIGGHEVAVLGDPRVVNTEIGDAVEFDGVDDQLMVNFNPLKDTKEFTVELVFKPDASYPNNTEPRFLHIQNPDDPDAKRVMIELRIDENNQCYMDGFINTDSDNIVLIDEALIHPTEIWHHVAMSYKDDTLTTYFDGVKELSGILTYSDKIVDLIGKTSLGARMNEVAHYSGLMKTLKVTHACLEPADFIFINDTATTNSKNILLKGKNKIEVFPNPADQMLTLELDGIQNSNGVEISVCNASGKIYFRQIFDHLQYNTLNVDSSGFPDGVYFISFVSDNRVNYGRIVIAH